jgi:hypothetical protein
MDVSVADQIIGSTNWRRKNEVSELGTGIKMAISTSDT